MGKISPTRISGNTDFRKFSATPKSNTWNKVVNTVKSALGTATGIGLRSLTGGAINGVGAGAIDSSYQDIINTQMELQQQMMLVSMQSNLEKTQHDTRMAPVRNLRVS